jgi:hypothetical protein
MVGLDGGEDGSIPPTIGLSNINVSKMPLAPPVRATRSRAAASLFSDTPVSQQNKDDEL